MVMNKDGSNERVLVRGRGFTSGFSADATHLYWTEQDEQNTLRRVSKKGGAPEVVWSEADRWISAVTTDGCNVYWAVSNPSAVYGKSL